MSVISPPPSESRGRVWNPTRADAWYWGDVDPRFRQSVVFGLVLNALLIVLFTLPMTLRGCVGMQEAYGLPKGSGSESIAARRVVVRKVQVKPKKTIMVNPRGAVSLYVPDIDESKVMEVVQDQTLNQYTAGKGGKLGKGGGTEGGWPSGMENARLRFIRLEYEGGDWDQDMGVDSDYNLLLQYAEMTGFKIAEGTEHIPITALKHFPKDRAPPFVFITGKGGITVTSEDVKTLRWYMTEEGGLLFADNGGGTFDQSFRALMAQVFPDLQWVDIPNDDIIFQQPFLFPGGAPPLWHHSGTRAMGLKYNGRWVVFYHQGDVNDAWKTGHSGASEFLASEAYKLGVNVIYYAFNQYSALHPGPGQ